MAYTYTAVAIITEHGAFATEVPDIELPLSQFIDKVLVPTLLAAGYSTNAINNHIQGANL